MTTDLNVHLVLQGKGGVGKSAIAALLAQWLADPNGGDASVTCIDTDPVNATFAGYTTLQVHRIDILENEEINPRRFDEMMELVMSQSQDAVIDNGASSFVPLAHYLLSNETPALLQELGRTLVLHVVITGGPATLDTLHGFSELVRQFPEPSRFVVWLNPFFGPVVYKNKPFEELKVFTENRGRISALVQLPMLRPDTFGIDLRDMLTARRTFAEMLADTSVNLMQRQRLKLIRQQVYEQLAAAANGGVL